MVDDSKWRQNITVFHILSRAQKIRKKTGILVIFMQSVNHF